MQKQTYSVSINAPKEKVWQILWGDQTYPQWTSVFAEGSRADTDWEKGSKVLFHDGKGQGMVSLIAEKIPDQYMSFKHLGMLKNDVEDLDSEQTKAWAGAMENYTLTGANGKTELVVDIDITEEHKAYFEKTWPLALAKLKEMAEG
jgi:hypothetical protein